MLSVGIPIESSTSKVEFKQTEEEYKSDLRETKPDSLSGKSSIKSHTNKVVEHFDPKELKVEEHQRKELVSENHNSSNHKKPVVGKYNKVEGKSESKEDKPDNKKPPEVKRDVKPESQRESPKTEPTKVESRGVAGFLGMDKFFSFVKPSASSASK